MCSGASMDVFVDEPLPEDNPLWGMDNVLLSPHNTDMTDHFLQDSVRKFVEAVPKFVNGKEANVHLVDKREGY